MAASTQNVIAAGDLDGLRFVRLYLLDLDDADRLATAADSNDYVFAYSLVDFGEVDGFDREEKATQLVTLDGTEDEVFDGLNKNNRYKVRRSYRDEDVVVLVDDPDREASLAFYQAVKTADGVVPDIEEDFTTVRWINAYREGNLISSTCWFDSGRILRAKHIVSTRKELGADSNLIGRLTRRLFWEACVVGIGEGHQYVDLGGVDTNTEVKSGVADFKLSFGGETVDVFVYRRTTPDWDEMIGRVADRVVV